MLNWRQVIQIHLFPLKERVCVQNIMDIECHVCIFHNDESKLEKERCGEGK
jgi:hypothetical protein